jgi:hypothetical protein
LALTIDWEGIGLLTDAESITNWGIDGAGGVSISLNTETFLQGANSVGSKMAAGKDGWIYYDYGSAVGTLDFNGGNADGQLVYIWFNTTTVGNIDEYANYGMSVRLGTDTGNYRSWVITSSDLIGNGYTGGWGCAVIDPNVAGSGTDTGSYSADTINFLGIYYSSTGSSVAQNVFVDTIAVAKGLRITGTGASDGWQDVADYCNASPVTRILGALQEKLGIYFVYGTFFLGDSTQTGDTTLVDAGRVFRFGDWEYADSISTYASTISDGQNGLVIEDASTYPTTYTETGSFFLGSENAGTLFNLFGGDEATSISTMSGVTWQRITTSFTWGDDSDHTATNCVWSNCAEIDFVGAVVVRGATFKNYAGELAAVLYNTSWDVRESQFINNDGGTASHGVRHTDGTAATYYDLTFSDNDYDVYLNHASDNLTISKDGTSNPTTYTSSGSGTVSFVGTVNLKLTVKDESGTAIVGARCMMEAGDNSGAAPFLDSVSITESGGTGTVTHTAHGLITGQMVNIRGCVEPEYNGAGKVITYISSTQYSYAVSDSPSSPATGSPTSTQCFLSEVTISGGVAEESFNAGATQTYRGKVRHTGGTPLYKDVTYSGADCSEGLDLPIQMAADE